MEGKKMLAPASVWFLVVVVLLSAQPRQVSAISKFCRCHKQCYAECRKDLGPYPCNFQCLQNCVNDQLPPERPTSPADCNTICLVRVCGVMSPGDANACLVDCRKSIGRSATLEEAN